MFIITMPYDFKVGETRDVNINGKPSRVTWKEQRVMVIEPDDERDILAAATDDVGIEFLCNDARVV